MSAKVFDPMAVKCHWCSRWRPNYRVHKLHTGQTICDHCLEWHFHALEFLGGAPPRGCQECGTTWEVLQARTPGDAVRMYVVPKDGINQMLCHPCTLAYAAKRPDLYKGTKFWTELEAIA